MGGKQLSQGGILYTAVSLFLIFLFAVGAFIVLKSQFGKDNPRESETTSTNTNSPTGTNTSTSFTNTNTIATETTEETAEFLTYRNETYGYAIDFPSTWKEYSALDASIVSTSPSTFTDTQTLLTGVRPSVTFEIQVIPDTVLSTTPDLMEFEGKYLQGAKEVKELSTQSSTTCCTMIKYELNGNRAYVVNNNGDVVKIVTNQNTILADTIASSIKPIALKATTYTDTTYGFSLTFPETWGKIFVFQRSSASQDGSYRERIELASPLDSKREMSVYVFAKNALETDVYDLQTTLIGEDASYAYRTILPETTLNSQGISIDGTEWEAIQNEIVQVTKTFVAKR